MVVLSRSNHSCLTVASCGVRRSRDQNRWLTQEIFALNHKIELISTLSVSRKSFYNENPRIGG